MRALFILAVLLLTGCRSFREINREANARHIKALESYGYTHSRSDTISDITATNNSQ